MSSKECMGGISLKVPTDDQRQRDVVAWRCVECGMRGEYPARHMPPIGVFSHEKPEKKKDEYLLLQIDSAIRDIVADIENDYVDCVAQAIYESLTSSVVPDISIPVSWDDLNFAVKGYYSGAAIAAIKALLGVYFREEQALAAQKQEQGRE